MKGNRILKLMATVALIVLAATACAPAVALVQDVVGTPTVVQPISQELKSELKLEGDGDVAVQASTPTTVITAQTGDAEALQDQLTLLYREVNPSVVYIIVTNGETGLAASGGSGSGW
ncbi:MAG: hypothetical protein J7M39_04565, partial [Anaerolineae bacterium]|nr:hypothetical protein [Anaerolineae bacterium]